MKTYGAVFCSYILITAIFTISCSKKSTTEPAAKEPSKWVLLWSDEFDGETIDHAKWTHMIGDGTDYGEQPGWGNNEQQFYTDDPANSGIMIDDDGESVLFIEAVHAQAGESEYTSAKLTTENLFTFRFGKIEARIKLPYSQGIWPAFWMLGSNKPEIDWPGCGEIDILEMLGGAEETVHGNIHYVNSENEHDENLGSSTLAEGKYSDDYHTYSIEWYPETIKWLVDGEYFHELEIAEDMKEFLRSHYLILNVAVGGYWPGYPDETSVFPQKMLVDYVRVYQDTTLTNIPAEPPLDVDEETMGLGSSSALAAINSDFTAFHNIQIVKYGPASPDISVSTVAIEGETSILAVYGGGDWGGFWFELDAPVDMSAYANGNLVVMLDVPENIADFEVKLESTGGFASLNLLDYPSEPVDNIFDKFTIPLADFVALGLHLENLHIPFALWNPKDIEGAYTGGNVLVDNIYFE
jgi:beta-glucanase (GH16 family)